LEALDFSDLGAMDFGGDGMDDLDAQVDAQVALLNLLIDAPLDQHRSHFDFVLGCYDPEDESSWGALGALASCNRSLRQKSQFGQFGELLDEARSAVAWAVECNVKGELESLPWGHLCTDVNCEELRLSDKEITSSQLSLMMRWASISCDAPYRKVDVLDLSNNELMCIRSLASAVAAGQLKKLEELDFSQNEIEWWGGIADFCAVIADGALPKLYWLGFGGNKISSRGVIALAGAIENGALASLETIEVDDYGDEVNTALLNACEPRGIEACIGTRE